MTSEMTLEQVRDNLRMYATTDCDADGAPLLTECADAIDAHLAQPARAVDVGAIREVIARLSGAWNIHGSEAVRLASKLTRALSGEKAGPAGEVTFDMVRIAEHLCPTDLPHLDKLRWKARKLTELLPASPTPGKEG